MVYLKLIEKKSIYAMQNMGGIVMIQDLQYVYIVIMGS